MPTLDLKPGHKDYPQWIVLLLGKIITVGLETTKVVKSLPGL